MCGIVGVAGNITVSEDTLFRDLLVMDTLRGFDSTGTVYVPKNPNAFIISEKDVGPPQNLWEYGHSEVMGYRGQISPQKNIGYPKCLIGHNRAATMGKVNVANAHPFDFGDVHGVHNGTLTQWHELVNSSVHEVDSKALIETIATKGIDHTWKSFYGAAAVVWWDDSDNTINLVRNSQRPLFIAESLKENDLLMWASESWMLYAACTAERSDIKLKVQNEKTGSLVKKLEVDHLYKFHVKASGYELLEDRKLEKKPVYTHNVGTTTSQASSTKKVVPISKPLNTHGWAKDLDKGDKEFRGTMVKLSHIVDDKVVLYTLSGEGKPESKLIRAWPQNENALRTFKLYCKSLEDNPERIMYFKIEARPRISNDKHYDWEVSLADLKHSHTAIVPSRAKEEPTENFTYHFFQGHGPVSTSRWKELAKALPNKGGCTNCNGTLVPEEAEDMIWSDSNNIFCSACADLPEVSSYMHQYSGTTIH